MLGSISGEISLSDALSRSMVELAVALGDGVRRQII